MAADGRDIRGYYFDPEKGKYFKIEKNHIASPSGKYTQESVNSIREETRKRKRAHDEQQARQAQVLHRSSVLQNALATGTAVDRELGGKSQSVLLSLRSEAITQGLYPKACVTLERQVLGLSEPQMSCFDYDTATGALLVGVSDHPEQGAVLCVDPSDGSADFRQDVNRTPTLNIHGIVAVKSSISSVNISPSRSVVITSQGNDTPPIVHLTRLLEPSEAQVGSTLMDIGLSMQFRHPDVATIWCSAPNPYNSSGHDEIAIGTQTSVVMLRGSGQWESHLPMRTRRDVLALGWTDPHTLAVGFRSAKVRLWDSRSNGSSLRIRHRGAVTGIKSAGDPTQIVVNGLRNSLCMYDLRMVRDPAEFRQPSEALLDFVSVQHEQMVQTGFDVDTELGLVIAANDMCTLGLYSLRNGKELKQWNMSQDVVDHNGDKIMESKGTVRCARFIPTESGSPKIMVSYNSRIVECAW